MINFNALSFSQAPEGPRQVMGILQHWGGLLAGFVWLNPPCVPFPELYPVGTAVCWGDARISPPKFRRGIGDRSGSPSLRLRLSIREAGETLQTVVLLAHADPLSTRRCWAYRTRT